MVYNNAVEDTFFTIATLIKLDVPVNKLLYWKVQAVNTRGSTSGYSSISSFLIYALSAHSGRLPLATGCEIVPGRSSVSLKYSIKDQSPVSIEIFDIRGNRVVSNRTFANPGTYTCTPGRLNMGYYVIWFKAGNVSKKMKTAVLK